MQRPCSHKSLSKSRTTWSRSGDGHLEWPPRIVEFIHSRNVFQKEVITLNRLWKEEEAWFIRREGKMEETEDQALIIQRISLKNMKNSNLQELLIHLSIWIRNDAIINEEDDEAEGSRRSIPMKQIKINIQLSFHDIVLLCIGLYLVIVLCMIGCLH